MCHTTPHKDGRGEEAPQRYGLNFTCPPWCVHAHKHNDDTFLKFLLKKKKHKEIGCRILELARNVQGEKRAMLKLNERSG